MTLTTDAENFFQHVTNRRVDHSTSHVRVDSWLIPRDSARVTEFSMRGLLMALLTIDLSGDATGNDRARVRFTKTLAKKTTVTTV